MSGHARPPKWIAEAKDRARSLIDGLGIKRGKEREASGQGHNPQRQAQGSTATRVSRPEIRRDLEWSRSDAGLAGLGERPEQIPDRCKRCRQVRDECRG